MALLGAQGVPTGSRDASQRIGYLTKYLTRHVGDRHQAGTEAQAGYAARLADALRYEPCSPTCANWLRYGTQPRNPLTVEGHPRTLTGPSADLSPGRTPCALPAWL